MDAGLIALDGGDAHGRYREARSAWEALDLRSSSALCLMDEHRLASDATSTTELMVPFNALGADGLMTSGGRGRLRAQDSSRSSTTGAIASTQAAILRARRVEVVVRHERPVVPRRPAGLEDLRHEPDLARLARLRHGSRLREGWRRSAGRDRRTPRRSG